MPKSKAAVYKSNLVGEEVRPTLVKITLRVHEWIRLMGVKERRKPGPMAAIMLERLYEEAEKDGKP